MSNLIAERRHLLYLAESIAIDETGASDDSRADTFYALIKDLADGWSLGNVDMIDEMNTDFDLLRKMMTRFAVIVSRELRELDQ